MATVQRVAQLFGWIFVLVGVIGLFYARSMEMGMLFGIFPVNLPHNIVHLLFGFWGIAAARSFGGAKTYCQFTGFIYILLAVLGYFDPTGFGMVPIGNHDLWLHAAFGVILAYFGFTAKGGVPTGTATM